MEEIYDVASEEGRDDLDYAATLGLLEKVGGAGRPAEIEPDYG